MKTRRNTDHCKVHSGDKPDGMAYALECRHCGTIQKVAVPIAADLYIILCRAFVKRHARCPAPADPLLTPSS